ncbi:META domain-containing protein [bacterium]|nr:META domain-containing protein [bacterium]
MQVKISLLLSLFLISGCAKESIDANFVDDNWLVTSMFSPQGVLQNSPEEYPVTFSEGNVTIKLEENTAFGTFNIPQEGDIEFSSLGSTLKCCDSKFAEQVVQVIPTVTSYYVKKEQLYLEGDQIIVLRKE